MSITYHQRQQSLQRTAQRLRGRIARLQQVSNRLAWLRLGVFLLGVTVTFFSFAIGGVAVWIAALVSIAAFGAAVAVHRRVQSGLERYTLLLKIKETHLARQTLDWDKIPAPLNLPPEPDHPFELDIDITGARSLHQLLDTAVSFEGSKRLRDWLLATVPDLTTIAARQALVRELTALTPFRDKLTIKGRVSAKIKDRWNARALLGWLDAPIPDDRLGQILLVLALLALATPLLMVIGPEIGQPRLWVASLLLYIAISLTRIRDFMMLAQEANALNRTIEHVQDVFIYLERFPYQHDSHLRTLCAPFLGSVRPSRSLRRLRQIVAAGSLQSNVVLWGILNLLVPWDLFFALQLRQSKVALQHHLPRWLDTWYELEALSSLASFAYLHPQQPFPTVVPTEGVWVAKQIGHPLIPVATRVCNDFSMNGLGELALITGSNMSGKSSFLRTVGVNMALAYAGSVVAAESLELSAFRLFTCIRVSDSLVDGFSYFYAEVRRLKALLDALRVDHPLPLFFLIDEIFRGTNNRERLIGSRAYIEALVGAAHGSGAISTHDLELTRLEGQQIHNYHFADSIADGKMVFDYKLRTGPSPTTNALKIMQMEGLPVSP